MEKTSVNGLSGGMKRRVEIARGLVHYPKVLFLDEPTAGLDPQTRANIWEYIYKLQKQKNITIFLTTHYMDEAEICNKVAIIDHGKIVAFDTPNHLKQQYTHSTMKIKINKKELLEKYLGDHSIQYKIDEDMFIVFLKELNDALDIVSIFKDSILDFEINKGTLK